MKNMIMVLVIILAISGVNAYAQCTTTVSGDIDGETWDLVGSPYCVDGDVNVIDLTIEPNVIIEFLGDFDFSVSGKLVAAGAAADMIQFKKAEGISGWQGMTILASSQDSEISYCTISGYHSGGLKIFNSTPVIHHCHLIGNAGAESGSGLYVTLSTSSSDQLVIENSTVSNNVRYGGNGAGIYAELSAGSMVVRNCDINNNSSTYSGTGNRRGGGAFVLANGGIEFENCEISGNSVRSYCNSNSCGASAYGGGIYISEGSAMFKNCHIKSNSAYGRASGYWSTGYGYGGGIFTSTGSIQFFNTIISSNSVSASGENKYTRGGGVYDSTATIELTNCTVADNVAYGSYNNGGITKIRNSIFYSNSVGQIYGTSDVTYSDVQGGYVGEGNIDADPLFKDQCYQLRCDYSPCVDVGNEYPWYNDNSIPPSCGGERNDMGAYGGPDALAWCAYPSSCLIDCGGVPQVGDFDGDGDVDSVDLFIFSVNYGTE
jgi:hypothetical protein